MSAAAKAISCNAVERRKSVTPLSGVPRDAMIHSMLELLDALRARRDELQVSHQTIDHVAGFPDGYAGKLLAPEPIKNLGWLSFGLALDALGVALILVENPDQVRLVEKRWIKRARPRNATPAGKGRGHADH
jgi:hypothetical protein